jgi:hypothetical protein
MWTAMRTQADGRRERSAARRCGVPALGMPIELEVIFEVAP